MDYVCKDPKAEVRAANIKATLDALSMVPTLARKLLDKHQLRADELRPETFLPVQAWLNLLKDIELQGGETLVRTVGMRIIENADFPPSFKAVEEILLALDQIYHLNHHGDVGHYHVTVQGKAVVVKCDTPYPRQFERGLVEGICRNKVANSVDYRIDYEPGGPTDQHTCIITVQRVV